MRTPWPPRRPNSRYAHDWLIREINLERSNLFANSFPLEKPTQRNNASLKNNQVAIQRAFENGFALRIDRRKLGLENWLIIRNQLPVHEIESAFSINQPQHR